MAKKYFCSRRAILRRLAVVSLGTLAILPALNIASANYPSVDSKKKSKRKRIVGSWSFVITFANGSQDKSLGAFTSDGITIVANTSIRSSGFGSWSRTGSNTFTYNLREPIYDQSGALFGEVDVIQEAVFSLTGDEFDSEGKATLSDLNGNIISVETTTVQATRIDVGSHLTSSHR